VRLKVDQKSDALYFRLDESQIVESEEVRPGIVLDFDSNDNVVGIEILNLTRRVSEEMIKNFKFETA